MKCTEALEWMGALVDREVSGRQARRLMGHIKACPRCYRRYQYLAAWKRHAARCACQGAGPALREQVRARLRSARQAGDADAA